MFPRRFLLKIKKITKKYLKNFDERRLAVIQLDYSFNSCC